MLCRNRGWKPRAEPQTPRKRAAAATPPLRPCDYLTCIFQGLVSAHGTPHELRRSTATVWISVHHPLRFLGHFQGSRGLKQKRKLSPGPRTSGHKPDPVTGSRHTVRPGHARAGPVRTQVTESLPCSLLLLRPSAHSFWLLAHTHTPPNFFFSLDIVCCAWTRGGGRQASRQAGQPALASRPTRPARLARPHPGHRTLAGVVVVIWLLVCLRTPWDTGLYPWA